VATIDRRIGIIFLIFVGLLVTAVVRATYLGSIRAGSLQHEAATQQVQTVTIPAERGMITDRNGVELAISEAADNVAADPYLVRNPLDVARALSPRLHKPVLTLLALLTKPHTGFVYLAKLVPASTAAELSKLEVDGRSLGLTIIPTTRRVYPRDWTASQVLGQVGVDNSGDPTGRSGLEWRYNSLLSGHNGVRKIVNDAIGQPISIDEARPTAAGRTLKLTIDAALQDEVEQVLSGVGAQYSPKGATAIVMNPNTGAVLALANWPRVNANDPAGAPPADLADRAVQLNYEPGSTFKAFTVAGALQDGLVSPTTAFDVPPVLQVADRQIHDAEQHGYETLTVADILRVSSNIGADLIGQRLGPSRFDYWVRRFGFGSSTGVDLPGEDGGIILPLSRYSGSSMGNLPFGQGESVTPMQIAAAYSAIANGGVLQAPHIVAAIGGKSVRLSPGRQVISTTTAAELRDMLRGVYGEGGTASGAGIPGYDMAGKTGTANIATGGHYSNTEYVASFVGMVPANDPQLLGLVVVDQPQGSIFGGSVAAPAFKQIVGWAVPYLGISPR
jgi:cell division protein FtsI (penicillin-binding protein 3)